MKKYIISALLLCGMVQVANAQGYYIYKNGVKQTVLATEMDSLVFFKEKEKAPDTPDPVDPDKPLAAKDATGRTTDMNKEWYERLDFTDNSELENAKRGLIEATPDLLITNERGEVWNMAAYKFLLAEGEAPSTVNPSLWRNALCNVQTGLFKVCEGIYQVRGYDMANMTFIKTKNGWMIFDVLMGKEVAQAAIELFKRNIDANPVNLNLLNPDETAKKLVEYMGGDFKRILEMARADYAKGDYQWVAQVTKELVYADPSNMEARRLCADALEQLGYQCESGTWRNAYLTGAMELRAGTPTEKQYGTGEGIANMLGAGSIDMIFEYAAIATDSHSVEDNDVTVNFIIGDEKCCVVRRNGVILTYKNETSSQADATAKGTKAALVNYLNGNFTGLTITGNEDAVTTLFSGINKPVLNFNIIEP